MDENDLRRTLDDATDDIEPDPRALDKIMVRIRRKTRWIDTGSGPGFYAPVRDKPGDLAL